MKIVPCFVNLIGLKGACSNTAPYYLDHIGISLKKTAALADSASVTGKELFEDSVTMAYQVLKNDITFDGFKVDAVKKALQNTFTNEEIIDVPKVFTYEIKRGCSLESISIDTIKLNCISGDGDVSVKIISNDSYTFYNSVISNESIELLVYSKFDSDTITIEVTIVPNTPMTMSIDDNGFVSLYCGLIQCDIDIFICKYWSIWALALLYKTGALILNRVLLNDRYNDLIAYGGKEIGILMAQLDSSFNIYPQEMKINKTGMYQEQLKIIDSKLKGIIKDSDCQCCFRCGEKNITETIQIG